MRTLLLVPAIAVMLALSFSFKNFLDKTPPSSLNTVLLANKAGVDGLLIGTYALLDGVWAGQEGSAWATGSDNWIYGSVAADDAHKGSKPGDQPGASALAAFTATPRNNSLDPKWVMNFDGIQRANNVLIELALVRDGSITPAYATQIIAQARFLRGFYESELSKLWRNVPYADENTTLNDGNYNAGNAGPVWDKIEADLQFAVKSLPVKQVQPGRANKYSAEALLVKAYMFEHKYAAAKALLDDLITNGVTSSGVKFALGPYQDNFNTSTRNGPEGVFVIQAPAHDGPDTTNSNVFNSGGPANCCGYFQPSFSFVNAFQVDPETGLPLLDNYNDHDLKNDQGIASNTLFTPALTPVDSRLDWTVGRRGIPYLDWGLMPGQAWCRDQADGGPYATVKNVYTQAQQIAISESYEGWAANQSAVSSYTAIRFADILLWDAEVEVEIGSLQKAEDLVNRVRARAANPDSWVKTYKDPANPLTGCTDTPAARYFTGLYGAAGARTSTANVAAGFVLGGKQYARKAVQFERRIELGMEGHRFFDLQRWDGLYGGPMPKGFMANTINAYFAHEKTVPDYTDRLLKGAKFTAGKNELYPIPQTQIDIAGGNIKQNPGY
ncbi:MAG: RagB/SusD family nutrient uptake outer membrane protein [Sphingobacteriales bacterium]